MASAKAGWNVETLFEHFSALRVADKTAIEAALSANEKRFALLNEFRSVVTDLVAMRVTRPEFDAKIEGLSKELNVALARLNSSEGQDKGKDADWMKFVLAGSLLISAASLLVAFFK